MAFAVKPFPAPLLSSSWCGGRRAAVGLGLGGRKECSAVVVPGALRIRWRPCVRCSSGEEGEAETSEGGEKKDAGLHASSSSSTAIPELGSSVDEYGGWAPVEPEAESGWKAGAMRVGAGFVLAIGVSLASYSWYQKQGRRLAPIAPTPTATQQTSSSKTSWDEPDYSDDEATPDELALKNVDEESEEEQKESSQADRDVKKESQDDTLQQKGKQAHSTEDKQLFSDRTKESQPPASENVGKTTNTLQNRKKNSGMQGRGGKVVVPAVVDRMQELALAALQALKVVEEEVDPGAICTRRDYARWLIATSSTLTKSSACKVFPAMYIEDESELAFDDVTPDDPDFPYIQGLAEAGLIPSSLSHMDVGSSAWSPEVEYEGVYFHPDSHLSRQDLVSWKVALDRRTLPVIDKEAFQAQSGFIDVDRIESRVWPAIISDLYSGDDSIIATAFGFTRRFQPQKAATVGQAAIALVSGETSDQLGEELARLEAERMAEEAVAADAAMEARAQKEVGKFLNEELEAERQHREQAEKLHEEVKAQLERVKTKRESEKDSLLKDWATVESEKELLHQLKQQVDEQLQALSMHRMEVLIEKERLEKLRSKAEEDQTAVSSLKSEVDVEKKALVLARLWAEDEAQKARSQAKVLEEARKRWASRGIEVTVDKAFDEDNIPGPSWHYSGAKTELEKFLHRAPLQDVMAKGEDLKSVVNNYLVQSWQAIESFLNNLLKRILELLQQIGRKTHGLQQDTFSTVGKRVQGTVSVIVERFQGVQGAVGGFSRGAVDGTKRFADGCRGEAAKFAQRFKHN